MARGPRYTAEAPGNLPFTEMLQVYSLNPIIVRNPSTDMDPPLLSMKS